MASSLQESPSECNVGWLLFVLRANRRRESLRIAGGRDLNDDEPLRQSIRERLVDGRLFLAHGVSTLRRGSGRRATSVGGLSPALPRSMRWKARETPTRWRIPTATGYGERSRDASRAHRIKLTG